MVEEQNHRNEFDVTIVLIRRIYNGHSEPRIHCSPYTVDEYKLKIRTNEIVHAQYGAIRSYQGEAQNVAHQRHDAKCENHECDASGVKYPVITIHVEIKRAG